MYCKISFSTEWYIICLNNSLRLIFKVYFQQDHLQLFSSNRNFLKWRIVKVGQNRKGNSLNIKLSALVKELINKFSSTVC